MTSMDTLCKQGSKFTSLQPLMRKDFHLSSQVAGHCIPSRAVRFIAQDESVLQSVIAITAINRDVKLFSRRIEKRF